MEHIPDYPKYGRGATLVRNTKIVEEADKVIAFPSKESKGTYDSINKARKLNKLLKIINI